MSKLVRLHPRHPQLGYVLRSYTILEPPLRFLEKRGWYEVEDVVAKQLADIPQQDRFPNGPKAFMIAKDESEAKKLEEQAAEMVRESKREQEVGTAEAPVKTTGKRPGAKQRSTQAATDEDDGDDEDGGEGEQSPDPKPRTRKRKG